MLRKVLENIPGYGDKLGSPRRIDHLLDDLVGFDAVFTKGNADVILDNVDSYPVDATGSPSYLNKLLGTGRFLQPG